MLNRLLIALTLFLTAGFAWAEEPLEADQAFKFSASLVDGKTMEARWQIAKGYYLYRNKIKFSADPATVKLGEAAMPKGELHKDELFGQVETYRDDLRIRIPVELPAGVTAFTLKASSQGCADMGICYPPLPQQAALSMTGGSFKLGRSENAAQSSMPSPLQSGTPMATDRAAADGAASIPAAGNESRRIAGLLRSGGFWANLLAFFGMGLLLAFTPCVLPMVPILSGIIVNHGHANSHGRAFLLSLAYVLGMAVTYAVAGVAAGLSGTLLSSALQNPWVLSAFALVFVVLSLSMFGFYELQLPSALQSRLSDTANRQGGSLTAITLMGALSALIVGPCVAAPLAGALLYIAERGDAWLGGAALFTLALGMGAPLLLIGLFSRSLLPKPGPWMDAVTKFFGVLLLATALWIVAPVLPSWASMAGWAALLIVPAIYLHALDPLPPQASGWRRLWKGVGVAMLLAGTAMVAGLLGGSRDPLQPLGFLRAGAAPVPLAAKFERVNTLAELETKLKSPGKPVMLDFYADWCVSCKEMEQLTFTDSAVAKRLDGLVLLQADVTANSEADQALLKRFKLFGPPGIIFFDAQGKELTALQVVGFEPADRFLQVLAAVQGR